MGQDTSGHGSWMDVFVKRGDKWVTLPLLLGEERELEKRGEAPPGKPCVQRSREGLVRSLN